MFNIASFLKRATGILDLSELKKKEIQYIIQKHTQYTCPAELIDIQKDTLILKINPAYKMALFMKKEQILEELKDFGISDIR
ncbi:MAG: hypothetical protein NTV02_00120 [Candidatus Zambryskibacteria bacterium]|nr:hypothetical protein [Candidatus Zambryskibacteria bacterium]